jgi:hypothetical protein
MSSLEATVVVALAFVVWQLFGIRHTLEDFVKALS